jgi:hypothetical protein
MWKCSLNKEATFICQSFGSHYTLKYAYTDIDDVCEICTKWHNSVGGINHMEKLKIIKEKIEKEIEIEKLKRLAYLNFFIQ